MRSLSILFRQCSYPVMLMKILTEPQVRHSSLFSSPVDSNQAFRVDHTLFLIPMCSPCSFASRHSIVPECSRYLEDSWFPLCFHSSSFEDVISFKSFNSTNATSLLNHFNAVSFEWALTHRFFSRILPDSSNFPGAIPKVFRSLT